MADYIVTSGELTSVANAIREKNGTNSSLSWPNGFVSGIGSGGGGTSDLTTAAVTIILTENTIENFISMGAITIGENAGAIFPDTELVEAQVYNIVLYKGLYELFTNTDTFVSVTGNATYEIDEESGDVKISVTGDCTITINTSRLG